ncbi:O-methyltransferase [Streptomyces sp. L7]
MHLLHGMRPDGVLTTVDQEPDHQQFARQAFRACGFAGNRARFTPRPRAGRAAPARADAGYDLVFCDGDRQEFLDYLAESLRRASEVAWWSSRASSANGRDRRPRPAADRGTASCATLLRAVREIPELVPSRMLPVGDGLLCAVKR